MTVEAGRVALGAMTDREIDEQLAQLEADGARYAAHAAELREFKKARRASKRRARRAGER